MNKIYTLLMGAALASMSLTAIAETKTVVFDPAVDQSSFAADQNGGGNGDATSITKDGVTFAATKGYFGWKESKGGYSFRIYKGQTGTISVTEGNTIKSVKMVNPQNGTVQGEGFAYNKDEASQIWGGEASEVVFSVSGKTLKFTSLEVTYDTPDEGGEGEEVKPKEERYKICIPIDAVSTNGHGRYLKAMTFNGQTIDVVNKETTIYQDRTNQPFTVTAGQEVDVKGTVAGEWMHLYVYVDYNNDGKFEAKLLSNGIPAPGSELVSYSYYRPQRAANGTGEGTAYNSAGEVMSSGNVSALPPFVVPADLAKGDYRVRVIRVWDSINPEGEPNITAHGGNIVDFTMKVDEPVVIVTKTIADLAATTETLKDVHVKFNNAQVVWTQPYHKGGTDVFIREGENAVMIHATDIDDFAKNVVITGELIMDFKSNYGVPTLTTTAQTDIFNVDLEDGAEAEPVKVTLEDLVAKKHLCDLVVVENVKFTKEEGTSSKGKKYTNFFINKDGQKVQVYEYGKDYSEYVGDKEYTVKAIFNKLFHDQPELQPLEISEVTGIEEVTTDGKVVEIYDLAGRKVTKTVNGKIYIVNGKKVVK